MTTNTNQATTATRIKVGLFTLGGLLIVAGMTIYVSHRPYWWRTCQLVRINVEDATGIKSKSPVKSLGLEIGYLKEIDLYDTYVSLGICITAPVEVLPTTKAYIRTDGILGDKFVELKPVKYLGGAPETPKKTGFLWRLGNELFPVAYAAPAETAAPEMNSQLEAPAVSRARGAGRGGREIPVSQEGQDVQQLMTRMDELVNQMTGLANNLKTGINPDELRKTMRELNKTLENASRTLSPEGGLNQTAQRTLAKLEDAIEQLRDVMTRVNKGEGSVGMLLNDPAYADELREAIRNLNRLLTKVGDVRFVVNVGGQYMTGYGTGGRGLAELQIWPRRDRYYLLGVAIDPRGLFSQSTQTTTAGGTSTTVLTTTREATGVLFTAMMGKVFWRRLDVSLGILYGDGTGSVQLNLGWHDREDFVQLRGDVYTRFGDPYAVNLRGSLILRPFWTLYVRGGIDSLFPGTTGQIPFYVGAGVTFDDEDIRLLFVLR